MYGSEGGIMGVALGDAHRETHNVHDIAQALRSF